MPIHEGRAGESIMKREKCTFLPCCVIWVKIPGYCDNFQHKMIAPLSNHVHHLPVANFHYILIINLHRKEGDF